MSDTVKLI